jgi:diacylglycerol kinase (ATP)
MHQDCTGLEKKIELYLDGVRLDLHCPLQSVVVLNIDSWGAGVKLWEMSKTPDDMRDQSFSDGTLEVFGIVSSFHIAQLQVGLSTPIRLGQAKEVKIKVLQKCPVQADGEPWWQSECKIKINHHGQATMLKCVS